MEDYFEEGETGHDPIFDDEGNPTGQVRMYPTGRIVTITKENIKPFDINENLIFGYTHDEIAKKQGIKKLKK